jgi:hypothetical protein
MPAGAAADSTSPTHPAATAAAVTRRLLYRNTLGRLRSSESVYRSAEQRMESVR